MKRFFGIFFSILLLTSCAVAEKNLMSEGKVPLAQDALEALFAEERTMKFTSSKGSSISVYRPNGTASVDWGKGSDKGSYWIENGKFCAKWTVIRGGNPRCFTVYKMGDNKYRWFNPDGTLNGDSSFD